MVGSERTQLIAGTIALALLGVWLVTLLLPARPLAGGPVIHVDLAQVGGLRTGAKVRRSGVQLGHVTSIRSYARPSEPPLRARTRVDMRIARRHRDAVWRNAQIYVSSISLFGEQYLEIGPPAGQPGPPARDGSVLRGIDPPVLDRFVNFSWQHITQILAVIRPLAPRLAELTGALDRIERTTDRLRMWPRLSLLRRRVDALLQESSLVLGQLWISLRRGKSATERATALLDRQRARVSGLIARAQKLRARIAPIAALVAAPRRAQLRRSLDKLGATWRTVVATSVLARGVIARVQRGEGTIGRILRDPELDDQLKATHKLLLEAPWRVLGKPPRRAPPHRAAPRRER